MEYNQIKYNHKLQLAEQYCIANNLSVEKLKKLRYIPLNGWSAFCGPPEKEYSGGGLLEDISSQPRAALIIHDDDTIETTIYTERFLSLY